MGKSTINGMLLILILTYLTGCSENFMGRNDNAPEVILKSGDYYVAPWGSDYNPGTYDEPWETWQKAFSTARAGDTVYFRGGVYKPTKPAAGNNITYILPSSGSSGGEPGNPICFFNYPGEDPVLDGSLIDPIDRHFNTGILLDKIHFIHFKGLTVRNIYQKYDRVEALGINANDCSNLIFENMTVYNIGGGAFRYLGSKGYFGVEYDSTYYINCDAYNCGDTLIAAGGNIGGIADGFKCGNEAGAYFYFEGCRAWNCSDDGFDVGGPARADFKSCWAFNNGLLNGDGCGWKTGGNSANESKIIRTLTNCIAANNRSYGLAEINYTGYYDMRINVYNSAFYGNETAITSWDIHDGESKEHIYKNNIIFSNPHGVRLFAKSSILDHNTFKKTEGFPYWEETITVEKSDFVSLEVSELSNPRKDNHELPDVNFMRLSENSKLIDAGIDIGLPFSGNGPDIGVFEKE